METSDSALPFASGQLEEAVLSSTNVAFMSELGVTNYLVIAKDEMTDGATYSFKISCAYDTTPNAVSYAEGSVLVNESPESGVLFSNPVEGEVLVDLFYLQTLYWADDPSDFPLKYKFFYTSAEGLSTILRASELGNSLDGTYLPLGNGNDYSLAVGVEAIDYYEASGYAYKTVHVFPTSATVSEVAEGVVAEVETLLANLDTTAVFNLVSAADSALSTVNCTLAPDCAGLNRIPCDDGEVDHFCGDCLEGYSGSLYDLSAQCISPEPTCSNGQVDANETDVDCGDSCGPCAVGSICVSDSDCAYNYCFGGTCTYPPKKCVGDCYGNGQCVHSDLEGKVLGADECYVSNIYCTAECSCYDGFYGSSCLMDEAEWQALRNTRNALLESLTVVFGYGESTSELVTQMSSSMAAVYGSDLEVLGDEGIENLFNLVTDTTAISEGTGIDEETAATLGGVLNDLLGKVSSGPLEGEATGMVNSATSVGNGLLVGLVPGQAANSFASDQLKAIAGVYDFSTIEAATVITIPANDQELVAGSATPSIDFGGSFDGIAQLEVVLSQMLANPFENIGDTSGNETSGERKLTNGSASSKNKTYNISSSIVGVAVSELPDRPDGFSVQINLPTKEEIGYGELLFEEVIGYCSNGEFSSKEITCLNSTIPIECIGVEEQVKLNCSSSYSYPRCIFWDGYSWDSSSCNVLSHNSTTTLCECTIQEPSFERIRKRRLKTSSAAGDLDSLNFASTLENIGQQTKKTFEEFDKPFNDPSAVTENMDIFIAMGVTLAGPPFLIFIQLLWHWYFHCQEARRNKQWRREKESTNAQDGGESSETVSVTEAGETSPNPCRGDLGALSSIQDGGSNSSVRSNSRSILKSLNIHELVPRIWAQRNVLSIMMDAYVENNEWIQLLAGNVFKDPYLWREKVRILVSLQCGIFTLAFWDATLFGMGIAESTVTSTNMSSEVESLFGSDNLFDIISAAIIAIILTTPCMMLLDIVKAKTIDIEKEGSDEEEIKDLAEVVDVLTVLPKSPKSPLSRRLEKMEHRMNDAAENLGSSFRSSITELNKKGETVMKSIRSFSMRSQSDSMKASVANRVKLEFELYKKKEKMKSWYSLSALLPSWNNDKILLKKIRYHVKRAIAVQTEMDNMETDLKNKRLLKLAHENYTHKIEKKAVQWVALAQHGDDGIVDEEEEGEPEEHGLSDFAVRVRHAMGWTFIILYCCLCAYYVCIFGIMSGPKMTKQWMFAFYLGFGQDLLLFLPLKLFLLYQIMPFLSDKRINVHRIHKLPSYAASCQLARNNEDLFASKLILDPSFEAPEGLIEVTSSPSRSIIKVLLAVLFGIILLLPGYLQELVLDNAIATAACFTVLYLYYFFLYNAELFFTVVGVVFLLGICFSCRKRISRRLSHRLPSFCTIRK